MHTLTDFTTHIKGVEYIISVLAITGFILFVEILKPKPFRTLKQSINEDVEHLRREGSKSTLRTLKRLAAAPFIGLAYVVSLPFVFTYAVARECVGRTAEALEGALGVAGFGWRPVEAYFGGKKDKKGKGKAKDAEKKDEAPKDEKKA
jgi:hypothetical protein